MPAVVDTPRESELRQAAVVRLQKRAEFWPHLSAYVLVNTVIVVAWFVFGGEGLFWPIFPILGWGIGIFFHAWDVFRRPMSEDRIQREMRRLDSSR